MSHDPSKVLMGYRASNVEVVNYPGVIEAGLVVRFLADGTVGASTTSDPAEPLAGISLGKDLSDTGRTAVAINEKGGEVAIKLASGFTPVVNSVVYVDPATGVAVAQDGPSYPTINAVYVSGKLTGIGEDGLDKDAAIIKFI